MRENKFLSKLLSAGRIFLRYPTDPEVRPKNISQRNIPSKNHDKIPKIAIQSVYDKFYFLLFREINAEIKSNVFIKSDLLLVQSINGGVGLGLQAKFLRSIPITWLRSNQWVRAFSNNVDGIGYRSAMWSSPVSEFRYWRKARKLWHEIRTQQGNKSLVTNDIEIADLVIDSYLRLRPSPFFNANDPFVVSIIWQALRDIEKSRKYFETNKPVLYFTSYTTYIEHGIASRVALSLGVKVQSFGNPIQFVKRLTCSDPYQRPVTENYHNDFKKLSNKKELLELARVQLESRMSGIVDPATVYMRQSAYSKAPEKLLDKVNGSVIIFLHDFYDSPHIYSEMVFDDFWEWVCFTIEVLTKSGISFFIKPHPNQIKLSDNALDELKRKYPNIKWLASDISNVSLANSGISCGVTVYGTVAHELAFLGVPTICSAKHPHHSFEFCRTAKTVIEYKEMLLSYKTRLISKKSMREQALAFYYMHNFNKSTIEMDLNSKYLNFWKVCNIESLNSVAVQEAFSILTECQGFKNYIDDLVEQINYKLHS